MALTKERRRDLLSAAKHLKKMGATIPETITRELEDGVVKLKRTHVKAIEQGLSGDGRAVVIFRKGRLRLFTVDGYLTSIKNGKARGAQIKADRNGHASKTVKVQGDLTVASV